MEEEARFVECLVKRENDSFDMRVNQRAEFNTKKNRANLKMRGGETEGGPLFNYYDELSCYYLRPLRDSEMGLRPDRDSQVTRLIRQLTPEEKRKNSRE